MKVISDIRLYKSEDIEKPVEFNNKALNIKLRRAVMKLREQGFSLGEFDHLYINLTTAIPEDMVQLSEKTDSYHPWFRFCNTGICGSDYNNTEDHDFILEKVSLTLLKLYSSEKDTEIIENAFSEAKKGSRMLMLFKEKKAEKGIAKIYLSLSDDGKYIPLITVTRTSGEEIFKAELPQTADLNIIGELVLSSKKVTVRPRKNASSKHLKPISFDIRL